MKVVVNNASKDFVKGKTVYYCHVCSIRFNWSKNSSWYGSLKEIEEHSELIKYYCSDKCADSDLKTNKET